MVQVFVYGTLKRGFPLFDRGLEPSMFVMQVQTVQPYPMLIARSFFGPMMLEKPGEGEKVLGELFEVPEERLPLLDELEDIGTKGSFRAMVEIEPLGGGQRSMALGYMKDESWLDPVHSSYLSDYQDRRFIPPWQR